MEAIKLNVEVELDKDKLNKQNIKPEDINLTLIEDDIIKVVDGFILTRNCDINGKFYDRTTNFFIKSARITAGNKGKKD